MIKTIDGFFSPKHIEKYYPFFFLIIFMAVPVGLFILNVGIEYIAVAIAIEVGIGSMMQYQISRAFFPPILGFSTKEVITTTVHNIKQKWYNLCIKNYGFASARNLRVKIRDDEKKSWVKLVRPFTKKLKDQGKDSTCIENLSVGEDDDFNIGFIGENNNKFSLTLNIYPNNQRRHIEKGEEGIFFLEIIADNINPYYFKMKITNNGYKDSVSFSFDNY